jgi:hypothetical protein
MGARLLPTVTVAPTRCIDRRTPMNNVSPDLAQPLRTDDMAWIPTGPG